MKRRTMAGTASCAGWALRHTGDQIANPFAQPPGAIRAATPAEPADMGLTSQGIALAQMECIVGRFRLAATLRDRMARSQAR